MSTELSIDTKQAQAGTTSDGVQIVDGLHVWTNEYAVGVVSLERVKPWSAGWFDVIYADGRRVMQNGDRVAVRVDGKSAAGVYVTEVARGAAHR